MFTVACPSYRLCGDLWHTHECPNADHVGYNRLIDTFDPERSGRGYPDHARAAIRNYAETLRALCAAGF